MIGIIDTIVRLTNKLTLVKSLLALSNLCSLCSSFPKARITNIPDKFSLIVKFNLSINVTIMTIKIIIKTNPMIQVIDGVLLKALINAPIPIIGAKHTILINIMTTI